MRKQKLKVGDVVALSRNENFHTGASQPSNFVLKGTLTIDALSDEFIYCRGLSFRRRTEDGKEIHGSLFPDRSGALQISTEPCVIRVAIPIQSFNENRCLKEKRKADKLKEWQSLAPQCYALAIVSVSGQAHPKKCELELTRQILRKLTPAEIKRVYRAIYHPELLPDIN